jgi:hypothetical protein
MPFARGQVAGERMPGSRGPYQAHLAVFMLAGLFAASAAATDVSSRTLRVGPDGDVPTIAEASLLARDGDVIEVQAGEYRGDVAVWLQKSLTLRAVGGRAVLVADGRHAEGKAIWVFRDGEFLVEGFDFVGARVPDGNGAGIRFERGRLTVRDSRFIDNQMGLLTGNHRSSVLKVERCEFSGPTEGSRWYHNIYVGLIDELWVTGSWSHGARRGHLRKSRARENHVLYNRFADGEGTASYELEFPNGGQARVVGNLIEQSAASQNRVMVSFGAEGYRWPRNDLRMAHNTLVNRHPDRSIFVRAMRGKARVQLVNNVWVGRGILDLPVPTLDEGNVGLDGGILQSLSLPHTESIPASLPAMTSQASGDLMPSAQYRHPRRVEPLAAVPLVPGARQP